MKPEQLNKLKYNLDLNSSNRNATDPPRYPNITNPIENEPKLAFAATNKKMINRLAEKMSQFVKQGNDE